MCVIRLIRRNSSSTHLRLILSLSLMQANIAISSLSCGEQHTLFLTTTGQVYSCGMAEYGRLGLLDNWNTDVLVPEQVTEAFGGEAVKQVKRPLILPSCCLISLQS